MITESDILKEITNFRKELHQHPELSGNEKNTALRIHHFIQAYHPDKVIKNVGGFGLMVIFEGKEPGKTIMFRADLDALPIPEESKLNYRSEHKNIAHLCGHDGHSATLINTIRLVSKDRPAKGNVIFLFQPSEENGQGALEVMADSKFIFPDYIFGIHNIPGFERDTLLLQKNTFAAASRGMIIRLHGVTSHASEPEKGISPAQAMIEIIEFFKQINKDTTSFNSLVMATIIHARLGEIAFGVSPGFAEVMVTLRSFSDTDMRKLLNLAEEKISEISKRENISFEIGFTEDFPATENDPECIEKLTHIASKNNYRFQQLEKPFKWSEDFGNFTKKIPGAFIGIGSGIDHPNLHSPNFDFPDEIIPSTSEFLFHIYKNLLD